MFYDGRQSKIVIKNNDGKKTLERKHESNITQAEMDSKSGQVNIPGFPSPFQTLSYRLH
jgi:hypothetical protein